MIAGRKRVPLSKHAEQISRWAAQGRDDDWIAATLGSSASSVQSFRSRHGILHYKRRSGPLEAEKTPRKTPSTYEAVLERRWDEKGHEQLVVWFDPAIVDAVAYRRWEGQRRVIVRLGNEKVTVSPTPQREPLQRETGA